MPKFLTKNGEGVIFRYTRVPRGYGLYQTYNSNRKTQEKKIKNDLEYVFKKIEAISTLRDDISPSRVRFD